VDWSNESYVRVYTRDTGDLLAGGWEGRSVLWELMRKADLAGVVDHGGDIEIVAEMIRMPHDVVGRGIERLAARGVVLLRQSCIVIRNYREAQEAVKSDKQRQKESRATRLSRALADGVDPASAKAIARPDRYGSQVVTTPGHETGPNGHAGSHGVTAGHGGSLGTLRCDSDTDPDAVRYGGAGGLAAGPAAAQPKVSRPGRKKPKPSDPTPEESASIAVVLAKLSERSGREYKPTTLAHARRVLRLLHEGYTEMDLRMVVWDRANEWAEDPKMDQYLRPSTLFGPEKFPDYLAHARAADAAHRAANGTKREPVGAPVGAVLAALTAEREGRGT
jgi:uncharacterized phage protein (TIGR02220 family)